MIARHAKLTPATPNGGQPFSEAREFDCACQPFLILPHEVGV